MNFFTANMYNALRDATTYQDGIYRIGAAIHVSANRVAACYGITPAQAIASLAGNYTGGTECFEPINNAVNWFISSAYATLGDLEFKNACSCRISS